MNKTKIKLLGEEEDADPVSTAILIAAIIVMVAVFALVCFFQLCSVNGQSMTNSIQNGDNVLITRYDTEFNVGDVIVLDVNGNSGQTRLIKRVIATENEVFKFDTEGSVVYLYKKTDGKFEKIDESYIKEPMQRNKFSTKQFAFGVEYTVPENSYLFLGDNRNDSSDSRVYGFAEKKQILGKMAVKLKKGSFSEFIIKLIFHANHIDDGSHNKISRDLSSFLFT